MTGNVRLGRIIYGTLMTSVSNDVLFDRKKVVFACEQNADVQQEAHEKKANSLRSDRKQCPCGVSLFGHRNHASLFMRLTISSYTSR